MKKIVYAIIIALLASINLKVTETWQAGLNLKQTSKIFKILNEAIQPFTNINLLVYIGSFIIILGLLNYDNNSKNRYNFSIIAKILNIIYSVVLAVFIDYGKLFYLNSVNIYVYSKIRLLVLILNVIGLSIIFYLSVKSIENIILTKSGGL